ncbi:hypothetical protein NL676_038112 [Syzygium grande]|nr:hypothetical protein NL676_038112 [Syzygium grande]
MEVRQWLLDGLKLTECRPGKLNRSVWELEEVHRQTGYDGTGGTAAYGGGGKTRCLGLGRPDVAHSKSRRIKTDTHTDQELRFADSPVLHSDTAVDGRSHNWHSRRHNHHHSRLYKLSTTPSQAEKNLLH